MGKSLCGKDQRRSIELLLLIKTQRNLSDLRYKRQERMPLHRKSPPGPGKCKYTGLRLVRVSTVGKVMQEGGSENTEGSLISFIF